MKTLRKNELAALGLLMISPMHGYRLNQLIHKMHLEQWASISPSSIYTALTRLAARGAVSITTEREGKAPERTVYHITPAGQRTLRELVRRSFGAVGPRTALFYLGLHFAGALGTAEVIELLEARIERLRAAGEAIRAWREHFLQLHPEHAIFATMGAAGERHMVIEVESCQKLLDQLRARPDYFERLGGIRDDA